MWIRSQCRKRLVKVTYVSLSYGNEKQICGDVGVADEGDFILGEYETVERAIEVLNQIQRIIELAQNQNIVYEMPEK